MRKGMKSVAIFGGLALIPTLAACGGSADADSYRTDVPKSLVGEWYQTNKLDNGIMFQASVYLGESIQVHLRQRDSSSNYWMGSFPSSKSPKVDFKTTSLADPDAQKWMQNSLFGSQDSTKKFKYDDGDLSFKFTMMGTTSTVHLRKRPEATKTPTAKPTKTVTVPPVNVPGSKQTTSKPKTQAPAVKTPPPAKVPTFKAPAPVSTKKY